MGVTRTSQFKWGEGKISGALSIILGTLSVAAVLCFHFPQYLTTPELRAVYPVEVLRTVLALAIFVSFSAGVLSFILSGRQYWSLIGIALSILATFLGGAEVRVPETVESRYYLGLDWFILDLLIVGMIFVPFEKISARVATQPLFRESWRTDLAYFFFSHVLVQVSSLVILTPSLVLSEVAAPSLLQKTIRSQPAWIQFVEIVMVADFTQYWVHRLFHRIPLLWKFHSVHHSIETMDWLAGSRLHFVDILVTRGLTLIPLFVLGFSQGPLRAYLVFVAFMATLIHANTRLEFGWMKSWFATPIFHHWHHAVEPIDKNFGVHVTWYDRVFGTYYLPDRWPRSYGIK